MDEQLPFCKCGCGQKVTKSNNKYIWGHNTKGQIASEETRKKLRDASLGITYEMRHGKEKSDEIKAKIGAESKGRASAIKGKKWDDFYGKEKSDEMKKIIADQHKVNPVFKGRIGIKNPNYKGAKDVLYKYWSLKLTEDDSRENKEGKIEVKCKYCDQWFIPTQIEMNNRIGALKHGEGSNFYCSSECKESCSDFYQVLWPKYYKPYDNKYSRVEVASTLRKMVFARDNWLCQKCEDPTKTAIECHHIDPVSEQPLFANDMDSCITFCVECHVFVHTQIEGCKYNELGCNRPIKQTKEKETLKP